MDQPWSPIGGGVAARIGRAATPLVPWALGVAVCLASLASMENYLDLLFPVAGHRPALWLQVLVIAFCLLSGVAAGLAPRVRWPLYVLAAAGWVWLALWPAVIVAAYQAGARLRRRGDALGLAIAVLLVFGLSVAVSAALGGVRALTTGTLPNAVILLAVLVGLPVAAGWGVAARRQAAAAMRDRAARLEHEHHARAEQARAQERTRIAREMHDVVAHRVSLMVLHAGALEVGSADAHAVETAALIRGIGRDALTDLREILGVLRSPPGEITAAPQPTLADLRPLLDQTRRLGVPVDHRADGANRPLPSIVERTAYRVVQEALTNVHKHAGEVHADVELRYLPAHLEVTVGNGPAQRPEEVEDPPPGAGLGLSGLRERVELLGGTFTAGPRPGGGFSVQALLPADPEGAGEREDAAGERS